MIKIQPKLVVFLQYRQIGCMNKPTKRWVLLADVVGSRHIEDRREFEVLFTAAIDKVNEQFAPQLLLPVRGWKGLDELAAVLHEPAVLYGIADRFNTLLAPVQLRMAVVQDIMDILPENGDVRSADGPAFHKAAALMLDLKKEGLLFAVQSDAVEVDRQIKLNINLMLLLKENWTERQRALYTAYREAGNQELVASQLSVTQQSVSKTLKKIKASQVQMLENSLQQWLNQQYQ